MLPCRAISCSDAVIHPKQTVRRDTLMHCSLASARTRTRMHYSLPPVSVLSLLLAIFHAPLPPSLSFYFLPSLPPCGSYRFCCSSPLPLYPSLFTPPSSPLPPCALTTKIHANPHRHRKADADAQRDGALPTCRANRLFLQCTDGRSRGECLE